MSKSATSFFTFSRETLFIFGAVLFLAASGFVAEPTTAQVRVIRGVSVGIPGPGREVTMPIQIDSLGNESSTRFSLNFSPGVLTNPRVALGAGTPEGSNLATNTNNVAQGQLGILVDSTNTYLAGTRTILTITFTVPTNVNLGSYVVAFGSTPTPQSVSNLTGTLLPTTYEQGNVIIGATAAGVDVFGRIVTPDGRGIRNAAVVVTDTNGSRRLTTTSSFGYYRFADVRSGQPYTISVQSRRYRFTPRVVQIVDTLTDFDFVGEQ